MCMPVKKYIPSTEWRKVSHVVLVPVRSEDSSSSDIEQAIFGHYRKVKNSLRRVIITIPFHAQDTPAESVENVGNIITVILSKL